MKTYRKSRPFLYGFYCILLLHANSFLAVSSLQQLVSVDFQDTFFTIITSKFQWTLHCVYCCLLFLLHFYCFIRMKCYYMIKKMCMSKVRSSRPEVFFKKSCSENMQQIYRKILMPKCNFNKVDLKLY